VAAAAGVSSADAWAASSSSADASLAPEAAGSLPVDLPTDKLSCKVASQPPRTPCVLVSAGSFNPPTYMHLRVCEVAAQELAQVRLVFRRVPSRSFSF
jgi:hypothetical protein